MAVFLQGTQNGARRLSAERLLHGEAGVAQPLEQASCLCHQRVQGSGMQESIFLALPPPLVMAVLAG